LTIWHSVSFDPPDHHREAEFRDHHLDIDLADADLADEGWLRA
jgi:hypothetical protein